ELDREALAERNADIPAEGRQPRGLNVHKAVSLSRNAVLAFSYRGKTAALTASGARSGWPEWNGGAGSYSIPSWLAWATCSPAISATTLRPKSIPDVTPPAVITLPSLTMRAFS